MPSSFTDCIALLPNISYQVSPDLQILFQGVNWTQESFQKLLKALQLSDCPSSLSISFENCQIPELSGEQIGGVKDDHVSADRCLGLNFAECSVHTGSLIALMAGFNKVMLAFNGNIPSKAQEALVKCLGQVQSLKDCELNLNMGAAIDLEMIEAFCNASLTETYLERVSAQFAFCPPGSTTVSGLLVEFFQKRFDKSDCILQLPASVSDAIDPVMGLNKIVDHLSGKGQHHFGFFSLDGFKINPNNSASLAELIRSQNFSSNLVINLDGSKIDSRSAKMLAEALKKSMTTALLVNLQGALIDLEGIEALHEAVQDGQSSRVIIHGLPVTRLVEKGHLYKHEDLFQKVDDNMKKIAGAALKFFISPNDLLQGVLDLSACQLNSDGLDALVEILKSLDHSINSLVLKLRDFNQINFEGLGKILKINNSIKLIFDFSNSAAIRSFCTKLQSQIKGLSGTVQSMAKNVFFDDSFLPPSLDLSSINIDSKVIMQAVEHHQTWLFRLPDAIKPLVPLFSSGGLVKALSVVNVISAALIANGDSLDKLKGFQSICRSVPLLASFLPSETSSDWSLCKTAILVWYTLKNLDKDRIDSADFNRFVRAADPGSEKPYLASAVISKIQLLIHETKSDSACVFADERALSGPSGECSEKTP